MDPMKMASAVMAMQQQAAQWLTATRASLAERGLVFDADLQQEIASQAAAHPTPEGYVAGAAPTAEDQATVARISQQALSAEYPENGFPPDDPRLAPIEGVSMPLIAIAAKAIGWSTDEAFQDRVATALGTDPQVWRRASEGWRVRMQDDVVVATMYGQLFSQA